MAKPEVVVITKPGLAGTRGPAGADGISAVNNIINPIVVNDVSFGQKTEIMDLTHTISPSVTLTFDATLVLKNIAGSTSVVYVEAPEDAMVSAVLTYPGQLAPQPGFQSVSFGIYAAEDEDYKIVKLSGSIKNGNSTGAVSIHASSLNESIGGVVAQHSFVQWSVPIFAVISPGNGGGAGDLTKAQADALYASRTDTRLSDRRAPLDRSVNANSIAAGGLPISSIDQLRNELDVRIKTVNGVSPDSSGNLNISENGVTGISQGDADGRYVRLNDARLTDQRVPIDNSVLNSKVPNDALDRTKINGLSTVLDSMIAQIANLTQRLQEVEENGATPGGGTPGTGYPAVYTATY